MTIIISQDLHTVCSVIRIKDHRIILKHIPSGECSVKRSFNVSSDSAGNAKDIVADGAKAKHGVVG